MIDSPTVRARAVRGRSGFANARLGATRRRSHPLRVAADLRPPPTRVPLMRMNPAVGTDLQKTGCPRIEFQPHRMLQKRRSFLA
jgi:hypothetical protein